MPLYMDYHKIENVTLETVKTAHIADMAIQDQYGVKYHQYWVNIEEGSVFCLVEGPDKKTCEKVHQLAHGNLACALTEVEAGFYEKLMGGDHKLDEGQVQHTDGSIDNGYRYILVASLYGVVNVKESRDLFYLLSPQCARKLIQEKIRSFSGREMKWDKDESLIGIFNDAGHAIACAVALLNSLSDAGSEEPVVLKIGVNAAQPVTKEGDFFSQAIRLAHGLSITANKNQVVISSLAKRLCRDDQLSKHQASLRSLTGPEEELLFKLLLITEAKLSDPGFDLNKLCNKAGVSRPQLYRKLTSITGCSPHDFLHNLRMNKALEMLRQKKYNIADIAFETGFNSPSYFTKCFTEKFGCTPSGLTRTSSPSW